MTSQNTFDKAAEAGDVILKYDPAHDDAPPPYRPPTSYSVGEHTLPNPLVSPEELRAHLCLLRAFRDLRTVVEGGQIGEWPAMVRAWTPEQRWAWFVGLAVERFQSWAETMTPYTSLDTWIDREMPPIDVLMVWHAYCLNPMWYAEDTTRLPILQPLRTLKDRLLALLVKSGDINGYEPSSDRKNSWHSKCGCPFEPIAAAAVMSSQAHDIVCPKCLAPYAVSLIDNAGTGYLQSKFASKCPSCSHIATKDGLAVLKFADDVTLDPSSASDRKKYGYGVYMAGTLRTVIDPTDEAVAARIKTRVHEVFTYDTTGRPTKDSWVKAIAQLSQYSMKGVQERALMVFARRMRKAKRVLGAYTDDRPFSVELVGAVIRQCSFIDKMTDFGWAKPGAFDGHEDEVVLQHAIARYHTFLDLMSSAPGSFFVPTLDIDLAWHTHQMKGELYQNDCMKLIHRFVDHDDRVEENHLATSFDVTCRAWQQRFQVPYTYCGCPLPGDTLGQKLTRLKHRLAHSGDAPHALQPPRRTDALSATHASEHSSVVLAQHTGAAEARRRQRAAKVQRRRARDERLVRGGKLDPAVAHGYDGHQAAFLYPVPFYAPPVGGCVAAGCGGFGPTADGGGFSGCAVVRRRMRGRCLRLRWYQ
ncbi:hypothetical protein PsYK624_143040 [Phanerochaete sordida]|uniref:Uncharacterized protein n=1 Tax=Phanerochaete sordida TaxID=48140 RepID=A0A9P3LLA6_9APHY|nr:hypothetical protein PsYK624_143040 [Phanerochaete sordida]